MTDKDLTVGVIGGLGPEATLDFYGKLLVASHAASDQEHLHVIINSNPKVPNRHKSISGTGESAAPALVSSALSLERAGANFLIMVCSTAHAYAPEIIQATNIPFLSIIDASVLACLSTLPSLEKVGLLAADGCLAANLYQEAFASKGIDCLIPGKENQLELIEWIWKIKAGDVTSVGVRQGVRTIAESLADDGAQLVLAACTELPLVLGQNDVSVPLVDSTSALVNATVSFARHEK